jgi:hypothetical protein
MIPLLEEDWKMKLVKLSNAEGLMTEKLMRRLVEERLKVYPCEVILRNVQPDRQRGLP